MGSTTDNHQSKQTVSWNVTVGAGVLVLLFLAVFFIDTDLFGALIDQGFNWSAQYFGLFWQILMLGNFVIALWIATRDGATRTLGGLDAPEFTDFQWGAMILCTLLAGGGVFWAAAEPIAHFVSPPPAFDGQTTTESLAGVALAQAFLHWGFLAWSILGSLTAVLLMYLHYDLGLPLAPRSLLYPLIGEAGVRGRIGDMTDIVAVIAVFAGTVGPIGFLGLQVSYGLSELYGSPDTKAIQILTIAALMSLYLISAVTGMHRGIQWLSRANIILGATLLLFLLLLGPTQLITQGFLDGLSTHLSWFGHLALFRGDAGFFGDPGWLSPWTLFFWGWFIGYGPMMAIFIARVSRGRRIRDIIVLLSIVAPLITMAWFSILGGTGLGLEQQRPGSITTAFEGFNLPAVLLAITEAMPLSEVLSPAFLLLTALFVATTGDSMTYSLSVVSSGSDNPPTWLRVFWGLAMGATAMILVAGPEGGIGRLQSFIVVTAVPVSLILLPSLWGIFALVNKR